MYSRFSFLEMNSILWAGDHFWTTPKSDFPIGWGKHIAGDIPWDESGGWDDNGCRYIHATLKIGSLWYHTYGGNRVGEYMDLGIA